MVCNFLIEELEINNSSFPDAVVSFVMDAYGVGEETGPVSICVDSGVTKGFQAELAVTLSAMDGKAGEY